MPNDFVLRYIFIMSGSENFCFLLFLRLRNFFTQTQKMARMIQMKIALVSKFPKLFLIHVL